MSVDEVLAVALNNDLKKLEILSGNVANINTSGFLKQESFAAALTSQSSLETKVNTSKSAIRQTGNNLDVAVKNEGFFLLEGSGYAHLSRHGRFNIDNNGWLKHVSGHTVMGESGPINLGSEVNQSALQISERGEISVNGRAIATIKMVVPHSGAEIRVLGNGIYAVENNKVQSTNVDISAGSLNGSNVESSEEMVEMIKVSRHLQTLQKAVLAYDQMLNSGINEIGK